MMEKIFLAIAIACSLYLNIQIKPQPRVFEAGVGYPTESFSAASTSSNDDDFKYSKKVRIGANCMHLS